MYTRDILILDNYKAANVIRRGIIESLLGPDEHVLTLSVFPRLGTVEQFTSPPISSASSHSSSVSLDPLFTNYKRWKCLADNMRCRRGRPLGISVPLFRSIATHDRIGRSCPNDNLLLDSFGFGSGGCSLQVTMQAKNFHDASLLHDQLSVLGPLMLAMTAATPAYKGVLVDTDARWDVFRYLSDDRTREELEKDVCSIPLLALQLKWVRYARLLKESPIATGRLGTAHH